MELDRERRRSVELEVMVAGRRDGHAITGPDRYRVVGVIVEDEGDGAAVYYETPPYPVGNSVRS